MPETPDSTAAEAPAADAAPDPLVGRVINDRFRVVAPIARGGMGKVYQAEQLPLGRVCALKILDPHYTGKTNPEFHKRFFLEASTAAKLKHPNAVTIYDYGQTSDDVYFIAMEYLEGRTLHQLVRAEAPLAVPRALGIARQVCRALREAHRLGVIHRDLKPANIFLVDQDDEGDFVKVLDFGLVKNVDAAEDKITQTGLFMGSPKYMAPEQIRGEQVAPATDVYALGVVLCVMLTGRAPFERATALDVLAAHLSDRVPALSELAPGVEVPEAVEQVVRKCLEKRLADRYASMDELLAAIKRAGGSGDAPGDRMSLPGAAGTTVSGEYSLGSGSLRSAVEGATALGAARDLPSETDAGGGVSTMTGSRSASISGAPVAPSVTPPPGGMPVGAGAARRGRSALRIGAIAALGAVVAVGVGALALRQPGGGARTAEHGTATAPHAEPRTVRVELDSEPPGAEVFEAGGLVGRTPLRLAWSGDRADPSRPHTFVFRLAGYRESSATLSGPTLAYAAHLAREQSAPVANANGAGAQDAGAAAGARPMRPAGGQRNGRNGARPNAPPGYRWVDDW